MREKLKHTFFLLGVLILALPSLSRADGSCPVDSCVPCGIKGGGELLPPTTPLQDKGNCHVFQSGGKTLGCMRNTKCVPQKSYTWTYPCGHRASSSTQCEEQANAAMKDCPFTTVSCTPTKDSDGKFDCSVTSQSCRESIETGKYGLGWMAFSGFYCPPPSVVNAGSFTGGGGTHGAVTSGADFYFCSPMPSGTSEAPSDSSPISNKAQ